MPKASGANYTPEDNVLRSQMSAGGARTRPKSTAARADFRFTVKLRESGVQVLDDFYYITLGQTLPFDWFDFRRPAGQQAGAVYTFAAPPSCTANDIGTHWVAAVHLKLHRTLQGRFLLDVSSGTTGLTNA